MFKKRRQQDPQGPQPHPPGQGYGGREAEGGHEEAGQAGHAGASRPEPSRPDPSAVLNRPATPPFMPGAPLRRSGQSGGESRTQRQAESKKLIVGRDISLAGEVRACDTLVVEGLIEADLNDSRLLEIAESGVYKGSAVVDNADIAGRFEGDLTVRERLHVRGTGNVTGTIRYGQLQIEQGGRLGGNLEEFTASGAPQAETPQPAAAQTADSDAPAAPSEAEPPNRPVKIPSAGDAGPQGG